MGSAPSNTEFRVLGLHISLAYWAAMAVSSLLSGYPNCGRLALSLLPPQIGVWPILYFLLSAQAMILFPQRIGFSWITIFAAAALSSIIYDEGWREGLLSGAVYASGYYFFGAFATATAQAEAARHRNCFRSLNQLTNNSESTLPRLRTWRQPRNATVLPGSSTTRLLRPFLA